MSKPTIIERLSTIEAILKNHVLGELKELKSWQWKLVLLIIASNLIPLTLAIILRVLRII